MNNNVTNVFEFRGETLKYMQDLARKDYEFWQKKKGEAQCLNTYDSCLRGIAGEAATARYIKECYKAQGVDAGIRTLAIEERKRGVTFTKDMRNFGDIIAGEMIEGTDTFKIGLKVEVKSIAPHHPHGQILPYHVNKYINNGIHYVSFVKIEECWDEDMNLFLKATVYECKPPKTIKNEWGFSNNLYGKTCYTAPQYL